MPVHGRHRARTHRHRAAHAAHTRSPGRLAGRVTGLTIGAAGAVAAAFLAPAVATTSVSGGDPGSTPPVVRGDSTTVSVDLGAQFYYRSAGTAANANKATFAAQTQTQIVTLALLGRACLGDNPTGTNNSPRDTVTVTDPTGAVVATQVSPARNLLASGGPVASPQPAPGNSNYRGDFPASASGTHGFSFDVGLAGRPAGTYTVTTVSRPMVKTDTTFVPGQCQIGRPDAAGTGVVSGPVTTTTTFEYRPWQHTFVDVFGGGSVFANVTPAEFQFRIGSAQSGVTDGTSFQRFYALPDAASFMLPSDPASCAANPASCLPPTAVACDPATACTPRVMTISRTSGDERLQGVFDLKTKAFYASAYLDGTTRVLLSLGTQYDAAYRGLLAQLADAAAAQGVDLMSLLATKVTVGNGQDELSLSLLNGLQIDPTTAPGGVQITTGPTVQAGVVLNVYAALRSGVPCTAGSASSTTAPQRYTPSAGAGYTVQKSDLLPSVPSVGALGALAGGPVYHIVGNFPGPALVNTSAAALGVDTAAGEPNGYPVWIEPFVSAGHVTAPRTMDFLGTATWSAAERPLLGSCLVTDLMLGTGVALYDNPLPVGFGTLLDPLYTPNATAAALLDQVDAAVQQVVDAAAGDPTVAGLLTQVTSLLG